MSSDKLNLRREYRDARARFAKQNGNQTRDAISNHIQRLINDFSDENTQVALYKPLAEEADFLLSTPDPQAHFFPVIASDTLSFYRPKGEWLTNAYGIQEPDPKHSTPLDLKKPILCFCPAVAVDSSGTRLGMGKGFYDRFFNEVPHAIRIAVVFQMQFTKNPLPVDSWDQPLDWIVTESMILRTSTRSP